MYNTFLQRLRGSTYYLPLRNSNAGMYIAVGKRCFLIDSGTNAEDAELILNALTKKGWILDAILNTHAHIDNFGGNYYLYKKLAPPPKILASKPEAKVIENPRYLRQTSYVTIKPIESKLKPKVEEPEDEVWADYDDEDDDDDEYMRPRKKGPVKKTLPTEPDPEPAEESPSIPLLPKPCPVSHHLIPGQPIIINANEKIQVVDLGGHTAGQLGFITPNDVLFMGDSILSEEEIANSPIPVSVDIDKTKATLNYLQTSGESIFVPSHGRALEFDISSEVFLNQQQINMVEETMLMHLQMPRTTDELVALIFASFEMEENVINFYNINATVTAFMEYLRKTNKVKIIYEKGKSRWFAI